MVAEQSQTAMIQFDDADKVTLDDLELAVAGLGPTGYGWVMRPLAYATLYSRLGTQTPHPYPYGFAPDPNDTRRLLLLGYPIKLMTAAPAPIMLVPGNTEHQILHALTEAAKAADGQG